MFGELVRDPAAAERVVEDYRALAAALPPTPADAWLSVDLTHLALNTDPPASPIASLPSPRWLVSNG